MDISPKVSITENNKIYYIPNEIPEVAAFVGFFEKGPIGVPIFISNVLELKNIFGRGIDLYYNDWYQVYNFLQYSSGIWVSRAAGQRRSNASNLESLYIRDNEDFDILENLETKKGFRVFAKYPGEYANLYSISCITKRDWDEDVNIFYDYSAKGIFSFFEDDYYGICVFRKDELIETYYYNSEELIDINKNSNLYWYINVQEIQSFYGDTIQSLFDGDVSFITDNDLSEAYEPFYNKDFYDIDIIIGNEIDNSLAIDLAETRQDCIAFIGLPTSYRKWIKILINKIYYVLYDVNVTPITTYNYIHNRKFNKVDFAKLNDYIKNIKKSTYVHFCINIKEQYDGFTQKIRTVNIAGDTAGLKSAASIKSPWAPGAGLERGELKNVSKIYNTLDKKVYRTYYQKGLNYIENNILVTQKTFMNSETSFNRINIRSLFNHIKKRIYKILNRFVFEENTINIRRQIAFEVKQILIDVKSNNGISYGEVYVHPDKLNPKSIITEIYIIPTYITENVNLRITNVGTKLFEEIF